MPAILRIFRYQTDASLSLLGQCGSYEQGGSKLVAFGHPTVSYGSTEPPLATLCHVGRIGPPGLLPSCLLCLPRVPLYSPIILVLLV